MKTDVTIISGFLGSGKTTLLQNLIKEVPAKETALIINDFGSINVDEYLLSHEEMQSFSLSGGCICCSIRRNLTQMIQELSQKSSIKQIFIECSGVADPSAILTTLLSPLLRSLITVQSVITVIDAENFAASMTMQKSLVTAQIETATTLLLNKIQSVSQSEIGSVHEQIQRINGSVPILHTDYCAVAPALLLPSLPCVIEQRETSVDSLHLHSYSVELNGPLSATKIKKRFRSFPSTIFRAKALIPHSEKETLVIHRVGRRVSEERLAKASEQGIITIIGEEEAIEIIKQEDLLRNL